MTTIPKVETILAFLESRGWQIERTSNVFYFLKPPKEIKFKREFTYKIPVNEDFLDYDEYVLHIVYSIAQIYELNKFELQDLLSLSIRDIEKDNGTRQKVFAKAS